MKSKIHFREFALLMALLMSIVSFSIDAVLPALGEIGKVFELKIIIRHSGSLLVFSLV
jgi:DHA1 family bicyclomycin/chloramphenicol resistance-like MFS transporter